MIRAVLLLFGRAEFKLLYDSLFNSIFEALGKVWGEWWQLGSLINLMDLLNSFHCQSNVKLGPLALLTRACHVASHLLNDFSADTESQASALLVHFAMLIEPRVILE